MNSTLYFQWSDIREVGRNGIRCSNTKDTNIFAQELHLCSCSMTAISEVVAGVNTTGWNMTISQCPAPQENLVATAQITVTNVTTTQVFNYTMAGSTADAFNYTSPYVKPQIWPFVLTLESPSSLCPSTPFTSPSDALGRFNHALYMVWMAFCYPCL